MRRNRTPEHLHDHEVEGNRLDAPRMNPSFNPRPVRQSTGRLSETEDFITDKYYDILISDYLKNKVLHDVRKSLEENVANNKKNGDSDIMDYLANGSSRVGANTEERSHLLLANLENEVEYLRDDSLDKNRIIHLLLSEKEKEEEKEKLNRKRKKRVKKVKKVRKENRESNHCSRKQDHRNRNDFSTRYSTFHQTACEEVLRYKELFGCTDTSERTALSCQKRGSVTCENYATVALDRNSGTTEASINKTFQLELRKSTYDLSCLENDFMAMKKDFFATDDIKIEDVKRKKLSEVFPPGTADAMKRFFLSYLMRHSDQVHVTFEPKSELKTEKTAFLANNLDLVVDLKDLRDCGHGVDRLIIDPYLNGDMKVNLFFGDPCLFGSFRLSFRKIC